MKTCHTCPHEALIKANEFAGVAWEQTPCSKCPQLNEDAASSRTLEYDEERMTPTTRRPTDGVDNEDRGAALMPVSVLSSALGEILRLPPDTLRVLQARYLGKSYSEIGHETGTTPQAAEIKIKRLLCQHEHLRHLLPAKAKRMEAKRRKRRSAARRGKPGSGVKGGD